MASDLVIGTFFHNFQILHVNSHLKMNLFSGNEVAVSKGNLIDTIASWGKYYTIEADITINSYVRKSNHWESILHFTIGEFRKQKNVEI